MEQLSPKDQRLRFHGIGAQVGQLSFKAGTVLPETSHLEDEISFIHSGLLRTVSGGVESLVRGGEVTFIPAGELHSAEILEDVSLSYVLITRG